ncbi:alpha-mannosidase [Thermodesulfobacteriota bacterium]
MKDSKRRGEAAENVLHVHVLSHTHWDFEWYEIHEGFKLQLVHLVEHLLDTLERDPEFTFHFDGQVMPIMDYLEVLKERDNLDNKNMVGKAERRIRGFVRKGQLFIGPCWSTPETSLISFESLIRNINRGIRFSRKFGTVSSAFYNADAFQYHSQVPQIIKGTGLKSAFTWRSFKEGKALKDLSIWQAADKTAIVKYHPPRTYAQIWNLPEDPQDAANIIQSEAELLRSFAVTNHVLITQGNDQFEAQSDINRTIGRVNDIVGQKYRVNQVTLDEFFEVTEKERPKLGALRGELTGNKWACTMSGQLSARMYLKQKNKEAEIAIEKWAEPFAAFAWLLGDRYPAGLMERAWEYLMKQHFHHCNACAIDEVHQEGEVRYNNAIRLASNIAEESLKNIVSRVNTVGIVNEGESALVIFNPSDVDRTEVVRVEIDTGISTPKDSDWQLEENAMKQTPEKRTDVALKDEEGRQVPYQVLSRKEDVCEIAFCADRIPPFGHKTYALGFSGVREVSEFENIANEEGSVLENEFLKITIKDNGSFTLLDKRSGAVFKDQNILEDTADHGDTYNYDPLEGDPAVTTRDAKGKIALKENGPFLATYEVRTEMVLPQGLTPDRMARSKKLMKLPVVFHITLKRSSPLVYVTVDVDNRIQDHRLRAVFSGVQSDFVYVQTQGDLIRRRLKAPSEYPQSKKRRVAHSVAIGDLPKERGPSPTQFQRNFVGMNDGKTGLVILNKGLPEYEARTDGTIALTLLRCVGWLSQDDLGTREGLAGPKISVPDAQCIRKHIFEYAVLPQPGPWKASPIYRHENQYSIEMKNLRIPRQDGKLAPRQGFVEIRPDELMVSAIKKAYSDDNVILRLFNPTRRSMKGNLEIFSGIKEAWLADLNEERKRQIPVLTDGSISFEAEAKKIVTISIAPGSAR